MTAPKQSLLSIMIRCAVGALVLSGCSASVHDLAMRGDAAALERRIEAAPEAVHTPNPLEQTPLFTAVNHKQMAVMQILVDHGADVNAQDKTGMTPLHAAASYARADEALWLLDHGADPTLRDHFGDTPVHTAAMHGAGQIIGILDEHGVALDTPNNDGRTPSDLAAREGQDKVVRYLAHLQSR